MANQRRPPGAIAAALMKRGGGRRAEKTVRRLATDVQRTHACTPVPVQVMECARSLGLPIERTDLTTDGGLANWNEPSCRILLPKRIPAHAAQRRRERFTIAHEIGHFVLRHYLLGTLPAHTFKTHRSEEEYLCNIFAGELLIPTQQLSRDFERFGATASALMLIQERYDVSLATLLIRVWELLGSQVFLTVWERRDDVFIATSTYPRTNRVELAKLADTTVHRALATDEEQCGIETFLIGREYVRWKCWSMHMGYGRVLSVGLRADTWHRYVKPTEDTATRTTHNPLLGPPCLVLQTSFAFSDSRTLQNADAKSRRMPKAASAPSFQWQSAQYAKEALPVAE